MPYEQHVLKAAPRIQRGIAAQCIGPKRTRCHDTWTDSIDVGRLGDLAVGNDNLFQIDRYAEHETQVAMTLLNREIEFERAS